MPTFQNINARYTIEVYNTSGQLLADLSGIASFDQMILTRSDTPTAQFSLDLYAFETWCRKEGTIPTNIFSVNQNEVRIRRYNLYLFAGFINHVDVDLTSSESTITVYCSGWLDYFAERYTAANVPYTSTDAGAIAWNLISTAQGVTNGSINITEGSIATSVNRTITYQDKCIKDAITDLSGMYQGFDFEITWDRVFNVFYPSQGTDHTEDLLFYYPGGNVKEIHLPQDGTKMANDVIVRGGGTPTAVTDEEQDLVYQAQNYLRTTVIDETDITDQGIIDAFAQAELALMKPVLVLPQIVLDGNQAPALGSYGVGDLIQITTKGVNYFSSLLGGVTYKIDQIQVTHTDTEQEEITLSLSLP